MQIVDAAAVPWGQIVRPGDTVIWSQACGEPQTLSGSLMARRAEIGGRFGLFTMTCYSRTLATEQADTIDFKGLVGTNGIRPLSRASLIDILPIHYSRLDGMIASGEVGCDVVLVQVSPPDAGGRMSFGITYDYICGAVAKARVVVAEINRQMPWTCCDSYLTAADIDVAIETDRPLLTVEPAKIGPIERAIGGHVVDLVPERAVLQTGVGALPDAVLDALKDHRDMSFHAGTMGDGVMHLMKSGAITNVWKEIDRGVSITGNYLGSDALYRFAERNPALRLAPPGYTHNAAVLARLSRFFSINAALEVDLTGQVNAEAIGSDHVGTIGGQVDYVRAAMRSEGGRSIIALPSTTPGGKASRIVAALSGPVTTARSDVDVIVTEWGRAELKALTLRERAKALIAIAHPDFREDLSRAAHAVFRRA